MTTPARTLRNLALCSLLAALTACGSSKDNTTSISLSGNVTGLTETGLVLSTGVRSVALGANATQFTFPSRVLIGSSYAVAPTAQPPSLICTVTNGRGVVSNGDDIVNIQVACVPRNTLGGTITGLTAAGLILANGSDTVSPPAAAQSFAFPGKVGQGFSYGVTVLQQPSPQTCNVVANSTGVMGMANVNNVQVACQ